MQKQIKFLLTFLTVLILAVSCADINPNDPNDKNNNTSQSGEQNTITTNNNNNNNNNNQTVKPAWKENVNYSWLIQDWQNPQTPVEIYQIRENGTDKVDFIVLDPKGEVSYSISVTEIVWNADNTSGIMYGTYTAAPSWYPNALNKWYAISFKGLSKNTLSISQAYVTPSADAPEGAYTETLEKAKEVFTEGNKAFAQYSDLVPQTK